MPLHVLFHNFSIRSFKGEVYQSYSNFHTVRIFNPTTDLKVCLKLPLTRNHKRPPLGAKRLQRSSSTTKKIKWWLKR
uniref:Uncharacterized protein n=1 Tax=Helianthus annuus TaxID=4232 RepID=A0A251VKY8_HELAN